MSLAVSPAPLRIPVSHVRWFVFNALAIAAYWAVLTFVYVHVISPVNATDTIFYLNINGGKIAEGALWALLFLPTIGNGWTRPSEFGLTLLYLIGLVPTLLLFGLADLPRTMMYIILAGYAAAWTGVVFPLRIPQIRLAHGGKSAIWIAVAVSAFTIAWYIFKGPRTFNIDLQAVYDYREEANAVFEFGPVAYLAEWTPRLMLPFCMCYSLYRRKWLWFGLAFLCQLFCFVMFQEKEGFIACVMLPILYILPQGRAGRISYVLVLTASILACELVYDIWDNVLLVQLWPRRFFFVEQFLYFNYFDVFSKIGFSYYSDSFMKWFVHYPFPDAPSAMVQYYAMGKMAGNPNVGFFGAGYMEMGALGVITNGFATGFVLKLFDRVTAPGMPLWFFGSVVFLPFFGMLIAQNFATSLLTGGVAAAILVMLCSADLPFNRSTPAEKSPVRRTA